MDTGMRPGSLRKLKWRDIGENTAIPKEERKIWVNIDVPAEKTKTGRSYRVAAPIAKFLERIRVLTKYKKMEVDWFELISQSLKISLVYCMFSDIDICKNCS